MTVIFIATLENFPDLSKRAQTRISRAGFQRVGEVWHEKILPEHFKREARARYRHQPRSAKYQIRKERLARRGGGVFVKDGGLVDLVFSGKMRAETRKKKVIKAFPTRVTIKLTGAPRYLTMRPFKRSGPDKWAEITTFVSSETQMLNGALAAGSQNQLEIELSSNRTRRRRRA